LQSIEPKLKLLRKGEKQNGKTRPWVNSAASCAATCEARCAASSALMFNYDWVIRKPLSLAVAPSVES
jgi:hypothetical protein